MEEYNEINALFKYLGRYYSKLFIKEEDYVWDYIFYELNPDRRYKLIRFNPGNWNMKIINEYLKEGVEKFYENVVNRIMSEYGDEIIINRCPKCNKIARTDKAKQCRFCGYNWH